MNHCHRCNSDYEKPGTCNCYAPFPVLAPQPYRIPYIPPPTIWPQPTTAPDPYKPTIIWGNNTNGTTVPRAEDQWSYTQ